MWAAVEVSGRLSVRPDMNKVGKGYNILLQVELWPPIRALLSRDGAGFPTWKRQGGISECEFSTSSFPMALGSTDLPCCPGVHVKTEL